MDINTLLQKAEHKEKAGQFSEARNIYLKVLQQNPKHLNTLFLLGTLYARQHKIAEAIKYFEKAEKINADIPNLQINLGNAYKEAGDFARAKICYQHALRLNPQFARAHHCLGTIFFNTLEEQQKALACFKKALSLDPNIGEAHFGYGTLLINYGNPEGLRHLEKAYQLNPRQPGLLNKLGTAYIKFNRHKEAVGWLQAALKKDPADVVAKYFLCIAEGRKPEKELREQYIEAMFDKFSESFEGLIEKLGYKIPMIAREFIETIYGRNYRFKNMVDLGCGTGLGGLAFRDCAEQLTGIDISKSMLQKAFLKNIYSTLLQGEVLSTLENSDTAWDLFLATDILVYFQELDPLFMAVRKRSTPGALFVFSTESTEIENFVIRESGRTAHSSRYIHNLAELYNFTPVMEKRLPIRKEHEKWVEGDLFIYKLP